MPITNESIKSHQFLTGMYNDDYFPDFLVDKCKAVLLNLCESIEATNAADRDSLFKLTHSAVESINQLENEFEENDSDLETEAREALADEFFVILQAYGFEDIDLEVAIENRNW